MRNQKSFFFNNILLILIFVTFNFTAWGFNITTDDSGGAGVFISPQSNIKITSLLDVFANIIAIILSGILGWLLYSFLRFSFSSSKRVLDEPINRTKKPPALLLLKIAGLLPKRYSKDLKQNISDMRLEYYEALFEKKIWRARCIVAFYYIGLSWSVVMWISDKAKEVVGLVPKKD